MPSRGPRRALRRSAAAVVVALALIGALVARPVTPGRTALGHAGLIRYQDTGVLAYGGAPFAGSPVATGVPSPVVAMASTPSGRGYWLVTANGRVYRYGTAGWFGGTNRLRLASPVAGIASAPDGRGYWLVTAAGGVYAYGDATNWGSRVQRYVRNPIVSITPTADGGGYWLLQSNGGVESFGDATWHGGLASLNLNSTAVGLVASADDGGYWIAESSGSVASFGDVPRVSKSGGGTLTNSVSGIAGTDDAKGYWLVASNGTVQAFGDAVWQGDNSQALPVQPDAAIADSHGHDGYWILEPDAFPTSFTAPAAPTAFRSHIVANAASQIAGDPASGQFCNPYGPCEAWCALFASWAWESAGVDMARYAFTGYVYDWAAGHTGVVSPTSLPQPGDAVLYGTGPWSVASSVHMGIVAQVWRDGFIDTIEGDAGPAAYGHYGVVINGPYLVRQSPLYNGVGVYGFAEP